MAECKVPTGRDEAEAVFTCPAHHCRLSGLACAKRHQRAKVDKRIEAACVGCAAGAARASLLGVPAVARAPSDIPLPQREPVEEVGPGACRACGGGLDPSRRLGVGPLSALCGGCVQAARDAVRPHVLGCPKHLLAAVALGRLTAGEAAREALSMGCRPGRVSLRGA